MAYREKSYKLNVFEKSSAMERIYAEKKSYTYNQYDF